MTLLLHANINMLSDWTMQNNMTFNVSKCKAMHISRKRYKCPPPLPLSLNGITLDVVPTFKYLGILISSDLSWSKHIQGFVYNRARKILDLL